jgi:hypothetical protein
MSDSLEITYCPHCKRPVTITETTSVDEGSTSDACGDVKEQSQDLDGEEYPDECKKPRRRRRLGFKP